MSSILDTSIVSGPLVIGVYVAAVAVMAALVARRPSVRWPRRRWLIAVGIAAAIGALLGAALIAVLIDWLNVFDVSPTLTARLWVCLGFAALAVVVVGLWRARIGRVLATIGAVLVVVSVTAMSINIDFNQYVTVRAALGLSRFAGNDLPALAQQPAGGRPDLAGWSAPPNMPKTGYVSSVTIPNTASGFTARPAVVYLPPAALTETPPELPVVILLSGQPGTPEDPLVAGHMQTVLDAFAAAHDGLAPIVVSPDQLGKSSSNPMCVDSALGKAATYLTEDVPAWITKTLPVLTDRDDWAIAGFSEGGTCAIQLGAGHPQLFGTLIDVSGELVPSLGDPVATVRGGFAGDAAAYAAAQPLSLIAAGAPFSDTHAVFAVGEDDSKYKPWQQQLAAAAAAAGMRTEYFESPGTAHDWHTGNYSLSRAFTGLFARWGLGSS